MKTTQLKIFSVIVLFLAFYNCKNKAEEEMTSTSTSQNETSKKQTGQAFIEDNISSPNILQIDMKSPDHTTLVAAVQAASLETIILIRSLFIDIIDFSEKVSPVFTPENLLDMTPKMKRYK